MIKRAGAGVSGGVEHRLSLISVVFGRRIANRESECRKLGVFEGLPAMGLDGLGSAAYGPEAAILAAKFVEGAWLTVIVIPSTVLLLRTIRSYYEKVDRQILIGHHRRLDLRQHAPPIALIPIQRWDRVAREAIRYALCMSPDVTALHFIDLEGPDVADHDAHLRSEWHRFVERPSAEAGLNPPRLIVEPSPYRSILGPLLREIVDSRCRMPGRPIAVVLPVLVEGRWWETPLHTHRERRLRKALLRNGGSDVAVISVPWHLKAPEPEQVIAEQEPSPA